MDEPTIVDVKKDRAEETTLFGARYRPIALLGSGGMGSVYLARDMQLDELVAVKVLRADLASSMLERFRDEVRLARRVTSPFVARTHDLAEHEGRFFVTMQYVEGETLSAVIRRKGRLGSDEIAPIARDLCEGLAAVHAANVVHRDLKPANVMMTTAGHAMLTDFGIALRAETAQGRTDGYGTPTYTAPEQLAGKSVDARADIYALGATLYALATGARPFTGQRTGLEAPPDPRRACADVPDALAAIVTRAMQVDPADRFPSCEAVRAAIDALRPSSSSSRPAALRAFVRGLGARAARRVTMTFEARGATPALGLAVRGDLVARLNARGRVRVQDAKDGAEASLDARFAAVGDRCALALRLESTDDRYVFWSDALQGPQKALPQILEYAANEIERAFVPTSAPSPESSAFDSAEVASLFLEARAEYRGFWGGRLRKSIDLFEKARALTPDHPLILAWCAAAHARNQFFETDGDVGRELAERAVALAPQIPEAHVALATSNMQSMRVIDAVPHFVTALRLAPGLLEHRVAFARLLSESGAIEPSLMLARGAALDDPSYFEPIELVLRHHALRGRFDLARAESERAAGAKDTFINVALARYSTWYRDRASFDAARARLDLEMLDAQPRAFIEIYADIFAGGPGRFDVVEPLAATGAPRRRAFYKQILAELWAFRDDEERTLAALEDAVDLGFYDVQWLDLCPLLDPLRGRLRFEALHATVRARAIAVLTEVERCLG